MLSGEDWDPAPEFKECPAEDLQSRDCLGRSLKMLEVNWRDFYRAAILELDRSLLKVRLQAAEEAINARESDAGATCEERKEMDDALSTLCRLKKVDW